MPPEHDAFGRPIGGFYNRYGQFVSYKEYRERCEQTRRFAEKYLQTEEGQFLNRRLLKNAQNMNNNSSE